MSKWVSIIKHWNKLPEEICEKLHHGRLLTRHKTNICQGSGR